MPNQLSPAAALGPLFHHHDQNEHAFVLGKIPSPPGMTWIGLNFFSPLEQVYGGLLAAAVARKRIHNHSCDNVLYKIQEWTSSMKLDKDLVREILLAVEASDKTPDSWIDLALESHSNDEVSYHVMLLHEAGFIVAQDLCSISDFDWRPKRLTIRGHEFLDTIRDREVWRLTKAGAEKAGGVSLAVMLEIGKAYGKQVLKDRLGIDLP